MHTPSVNADVRLTPAMARRVSPALMPPATDAPLITAVGALESSEFKRQNALIGHAWNNVVMRDVAMAGAHHLTVVDELANPGSPLFDAALDLVRGSKRN